MNKLCKFCNVDYAKPALGDSDTHWYWQPNIRVKASGSHTCRLQKRHNCQNWDLNNPEKSKLKYKISRDKRRSTSQGKLRHSMSSLMSSRLSNKGNKSVFDLIPYTIEELRLHLESQFQPGMTWANYGKNGWEVDHIMPDCSFEYSSASDSDFKKCWALNNLQPLWAKDNKIKNGNTKWQY